MSQLLKKMQRKGPVAAFVELTEDWQKEYLKRNLGDMEEVLFSAQTAGEVRTQLRDVEILSVFIKSQVDQSLLDEMPNLKLICTRSTGFDHIDVKTARKRGIKVTNVPEYGENTVAEHTFALILSLARNLRRAYLRTVQNNFSLSGLMGVDLKGKTIGVVGTGHIGLHVIRIAEGFGMKVLAYDVREQKFLSEVLNFEYVPFDYLLQNSDIVTLHVPYMKATHHLINDKTIQKFQRGALLINTARGGLVETGALVKGLDEKILSGAGLDVLEEEEFLLEETRLLQSSQSPEHWERLQITLKNHILLQRENVIYTPHMAFYSYEAVTRILDTTVASIRSYLDGRSVNEVRMPEAA